MNTETHSAIGLNGLLVHVNKYIRKYEYKEFGGFEWFEFEQYMSTWKVNTIVKHPMNTSVNNVNK